VCTIMKFKNFVDVCNDTHGLLPRSHLVQLACAVCVGQLCPPSMLVSEPDPRKNQKEGLGDRLGRKCTVRPECRHASDCLMIACLRTFIGNTNHKLLVQSKKTKNRWDLLVREVVGAQISSCLSHGQLEVPEIK